MNIESIYQKDLKVITAIFIVLLIIILFLIGGVFYYKQTLIKNKDYNASIVYEDGKDTLIRINDQITTIKFKIKGYNNTSNDVTYELEAIKGYINNLTRIDDSDIMIEIKGSGPGAITNYGPVTPEGLTASSLSIGTAYFPKNTKNIIHEYTISLYKKTEILELFGDINENIENYYSINFKIKLNE